MVRDISYRLVSQYRLDSVFSKLGTAYTKGNYALFERSSQTDAWHDVLDVEPLEDQGELQTLVQVLGLSAVLYHILWTLCQDTITS